MHVTSGAPEQLIVLPQPTYLPLATALATAAAVLGLLFKFYLLSLGLALVIAACSCWPRRAPALPATWGRCLSATASACRRTPR